MPTTFVQDTMTGSAGTALTSHTGEVGATWTLAAGTSGSVQLDGVGGCYVTAGTGASIYTSSGTIPGGTTAVTLTAVMAYDSHIANQIDGITLCNASGQGVRIGVFENVLYLQVMNGVSSTSTLNGGGAGQACTPTAGGSYTLTLNYTPGTHSWSGSIVGTGGISISTGSFADSTYTPDRVGLSFNNNAGGSSTGQHIGQVLAQATVSSGPTPGTPSLSSFTATSATIAVTAASGGTSPYSYQLQRAPDSGGSPGAFSNVGSALTGQTSSATFPADTGLTTRTKVWYQVVVTDAGSLSNTSSNLPVVPYVASTFFVSPTGSDSNNGTSSGTPWQTVGKVSGLYQVAGDQYLFQGGQTFSGNLTITASGTAASPIVVGSYGTGQATINPGNGHGVAIADQSYVTVQDLTITGPGRTNTSVGSGARWTLSGSANLSGLIVRRCTISGMHYGIFMSVANGNSHTLNNPVIAGNTITSCNYSGVQSIHEWNGTTFPADNVIVNAYVGYNTISSCAGATATAIGSVGNWPSTVSSGYGIFLGNLSGGLIESNLIHDTGALSSATASGGTGCIEIYAASGTTVRDNECYNAFSPEGVDGEGIDFDIGCSNCVVERNYVHDCDGPAFLILQSTGSILRWNIAQNNGRRSLHAGTQNRATFVSLSSDTTSWIYNNTVYSSAATGAETKLIADASTSGATIRNNAFLASGSGMTFGSIKNGTLLQGNNYDLANSSTFSLTYNSTAYTSLSALQAVAETVGGVAVGSTTASGFGSPGGGSTYALGAANALMSAYDTATLAGAAANLDLAVAFGMDTGPADFHGNPVRTSAGNYPVGAVAAPQQGAGGPTCGYMGQP